MIHREDILGLMRDFWLPSAATTQVSEWIIYVYQDRKILNPAVGCLSVVVDYVKSPWVEHLSPCLRQFTVLMKQFLSQTTDFCSLNATFPFWRRWNWKLNLLDLKARWWPKQLCRSLPNQQPWFCCLKKLKMRVEHTFVWNSKFQTWFNADLKILEHLTSVHLSG